MMRPPTAELATRAPIVRASDWRTLADASRAKLTNTDDHLTQRLNRALQTFVLNSRIAMATPPAEMVSKAVAIEHACDRLLASLKMDGPEPNEDTAWALLRDLPAEIDPRLYEARSLMAVRHDWDAARVAMAGIAYLRRAAELTAARWRERKGGFSVAGSAEPALFVDLAAIYRDATGKRPGISTPANGGPPGGPAVRFCQAVLGLLLARYCECLVPSPRDETWLARARELTTPEGAGSVADRIFAARKALP